MKLGAKLKNYKSYIINLIVPALVFGFITGTVTAFTVTLYKFLAHHIIDFSSHMYAYLRTHLYLVPVLLGALFGVSVLLAFLFKKYPNLKGGGIPTSIGVLRGIITFKWLRSLIGVFTLSLFSFLVGVPLGNEGPSVQMGTSIGRGTVYLFARGKHRAWDRYTMTGGACAGFSVATGAPISGILFAIEEAHQRISPTIMIVASSSVIFANIASRSLSHAFGVSNTLFEGISLPQLEIKDLWLPLLVGVVLGLVGSLILKYYKVSKLFFASVLKRVPMYVKIFLILALTVFVGIITFSGVSTGHELMLSLLDNEHTIGILFFILFARIILTIGASTNGITGGMFIPSLAIGATVSSILGKSLILCGVDEKLYPMVLVLGIVATLSGFMKSPLTAIIFAVEALACYHNITTVIIVSLIAYFITELFEAKSINDSAMEARVEEQNEGRVPTVNNVTVTVMSGAFAIGKQIRDIFWPANTFVLSVEKAKTHSTEVDEHGGKELSVGDELHIQYSTLDEKATLYELEGIVGKQME